VADRYLLQAFDDNFEPDCLPSKPKENAGEFELFEKDPVPLVEIGGWYEGLGQDFVMIGGAKMSKAETPPFVVSWAGNGDPKCKDIRARPMVVKPNPDAEPGAIRSAIANDLRVWRGRFKCAGYENHCSCNASSDKPMVLAAKFITVSLGRRDDDYD
jgi:hypothetical protein